MTWQPNLDHYPFERGDDGWTISPPKAEWEAWKQDHPDLCRDCGTRHVSDRSGTRPGLGAFAIEHLDWDPRCTSQICAADRPAATHLGTNTWCGCTWLLCAPCTAAFRRWIAQQGHIPGNLQCLGCGSTLDHTAPGDVITIRPL